MKQVTRTIQQRPVTFRCEWCSIEYTQLRYPGPLPRYCSPKCKRQAQNSLAMQRMRQLRTRQQEQNPSRRPPGRPRGS
jgi:hypothetical protein